MTIFSYRLPNGTIPVLLSSDSADLLQHEAAAVLCYAVSHSGVAPQAIAEMLFRTRPARKHRALVMVTNRDELIGSLQAVVDGHEHRSVVRTATPATARRTAYVFPGQGGQRPGMGRLFYESIPAFRAETDRCAEAFQAQAGASPLDYLLDEHLSTDDRAGTVQPALFAQMAGLAAAWKSFGVAPSVTIGHSQGEIAAAYVSGMITSADAVRIVGIRAAVAGEIDSDDYAMAVVAADRDTCEGLLARCPGWAELSVVNSPDMTAISGDRDTVQAIVDTLTDRGTFAKVIGVRYPAHTSLINGLGDKVRVAMQRQLQNSTFLDTDIACLGGTLGGPITTDLPVDQYWFWNLRNTVRFDKAVASALALGIDAFVELAEHPTLQLAIHENLTLVDEDPAAIVVGSSNRAATDLDEFTRNLAQLAVGDLDYRWDRLRTTSDDAPSLPLPDFPNTVFNEVPLWLPYGSGPTEQVHPAAAAAAEPVRPRLLSEQWVRLAHRSLVPPRGIGIIDHTGACAELAAALCAAAEDVGATARALDNTGDSGLDTHVILVPPTPPLDPVAAAAQVAAFFAGRKWWPGVHDGVTDCWLVTVGGEAVTADDAPPDLVHAAESAGFRSVGAEHLGVRFRHLDLPAGSTPTQAAPAILAALHTADESELALRRGGLYAKRVVEADSLPAPLEEAPDHVLIIGGTGNLGLEFCDYFARGGARRITLVCRSGETPAVADRLQPIRAVTKTQIRVASCDVSNHAAVSRIAEQHRDTPADLIIHAAVHYSGIELADITAEKVDRALQPKVAGIWRVLETFPRTESCRVVLCSSISATVGGRGMIVYAAANRMLDAMAHRLRAEGLDCTSVQWGHWNVHPDIDGSAISKLANTGIVPMLPVDALAVGMTRLRGNAVVAAFDPARARSVLETCGRGSLLSQLSSPDGKTSSPVAEPDLAQRLMNLLAGTIGVDVVDAIDTTVPLVAIGLDSLQALEFHRRVKTELDHDLKVSDLLGGASIADVVEQLTG